MMRATKKIFTCVAWVTAMGLAITWTAKIGLAAEKVNYSGKYSAERATIKSGVETESTLEVIQNEDGLEVTTVELEKRTTSHCPFNGREGDYMSPGGVSGKCKAQLKAKYLVLESVVVARPQSTAPPIRMHTKERWQLSADGKSLTIKSDVDFPDFPAGISAAVAGDTSGTRKYTRIGNP
jgi:hypothetical protein